MSRTNSQNIFHQFSRIFNILYIDPLELLASFMKEFGYGEEVIKSKNPSDIIEELCRGGGLDQDRGNFEFRILHLFPFSNCFSIID